MNPWCCQVDKGKANLGVISGYNCTQARHCIHLTQMTFGSLRKEGLSYSPAATAHF